MISNNELTQYLADSFDDLLLSNSEKYDLMDIVKDCSGDQIRYMRNQAFDLYRDFILKNAGDVEKQTLSVRWLEKTIKALSVSKTKLKPSQAFFSPGEECRRNIISACNQAKSTLDICVFTISDDKITASILAAQERGVKVRIITDNDKAEDRGSDVKYLQANRVPVKLDISDHHMHHKFAIIDHSILINGSFNWTRSASKYNEENVVISYEKDLITKFSRSFDRLWSEL